MYPKKKWIKMMAFGNISYKEAQIKKNSSYASVTRGNWEKTHNNRIIVPKKRRITQFTPNVNEDLPGAHRVKVSVPKNS